MASKDTVTASSSQVIAIGVSLSVVLSYLKWHSILWAIGHGLLAWLYVIYYAIVYN